MSRAVLLASGIYPLIIRYWIENLKTWEHKIDKVYIAVEHKANPLYLYYFKKVVNDDPKIVVLENCSGWPNSYVDAFRASKEDLFLIMHDDVYIYDPDILDKYFSLAEAGKVVTPLHEMYSPKDKVEKMLKEKYPGIFPLKTTARLGNTGGFEGYSFLLYLIFISRVNLEKTSLNFNGWASPTHDIDFMGADTGFTLMLDLLDKKVEIYPIPRYDINFGGGEYIHLQNVGNAIPELLEGEGELKNWNMKILANKLDWIYKFIAINDYDQIKDFYHKVLKRVHYLKSLI